MEQWIKEGKLAVNWTRLSCHRFRGNEVRLWLSVILTLSGRLALPKKIGSLTTLQQRLVKTGGRLFPHGGMRATTGCCWPKGSSRGSVLVPPCGAAKDRGAAGVPQGGSSEPGQTANPALRSHPVGRSVSGEAGWRREPDQASQRNCPTSRSPRRPT